MRKTLAVALGVTMAGLLGIAAPAQAAPSKAIKCKTVVTYNRATKKTTAKVVSLNGTATSAAVHSAIFAFSDGDGYWTRTLDKRTNGGKGYGPSITVAGYAFQAQMWQAGTACSKGGVTSAG